MADKNCQNLQSDTGQFKDIQPTDWRSCILCQQITSESLQCPADSMKTDNVAGYLSLTRNITRFHDLKQLPICLDIERLDEGPGMAPTLQLHQAKWHKSCCLKFNNTKLKRAEKRSAPQDDPTVMKKYTRSSDQHKKEENMCFFCEDLTSAEPLHEACIFQIDGHVRKCAVNLQDE